MQNLRRLLRQRWPRLRVLSLGFKPLRHCGMFTGVSEHDLAVGMRSAFPVVPIVPISPVSASITCVNSSMRVAVAGGGAAGDRGHRACADGRRPQRRPEPAQPAGRVLAVSSPCISSK